MSLTWSEGATDEDKATLRKQIDEARAQAAKGANVAALARSLNNDPAFDPAGNLGCAQPARLPKPMADALAALKDGEVSPVGETDKGFFFVKLDAGNRKHVVQRGRLLGLLPDA